MTELSNAVTVLIARMESHPEDFNLYTSGSYPKFSQTAEALYGLVGKDKEKSHAFWFLTDADKEALIEAWKKYHRTAMEKEVMGKIFDDGEAEREAEMQRMKHRIAMQTAMAQGTAIQPGQLQAIQGSSYPYIVNAPINPGQIHPAQNTSGNTGLLGSAGSALKGFFG